ncbi:MAG: hypothetical protein BRC40_01370 [Cyanobacteria bacterium QH_8_48_120]|jgi:putative Ca2+/H+ antiporter (TMEM165/GDT1 family)|nr:MAG: hypothetical protein BRC34_05165 [Cyanobacteria bacterium QH_1_48_107]PSO56123.1 MAG: hypothetical protein BRC35_09985 [Cyanobacteria bacterium QH_10_48_56]PSO61159.1 MAG: hypothetical protein BRC39_08390 [Cyanobacteria bacterium QH_7_48_89]PSO66213.1 MAG: hypothetical protein BRC38_06450 [Cyanobacteria bacterium QH_6_48_35]PSO66392.1 MAG: hypothetical protein BRC36_01420 [Cyanobacteria bacterium QH_2_48_84]PSO68539.1 MAG: hypothetical protein BRC42_13355 [Cyanobacteria bacterium QS_1_
MLSAFTASLLLVTVSELGDKTFFVAVILSSCYSRRLIMMGVIAGLILMTVLSVLLGQFASFIPKIYLKYLEVALFIGFGFKLLYDASQMSPQSDSSEAKEATAAVNKATSKLPENKAGLAIISSAFFMTFFAEWGDRTQVATIALAASNNLLGVTFGAILAHAICTAIAVIGGSLIAKQISERMITAIGGLLFFIFAAVAGFQI